MIEKVATTAERLREIMNQRNLRQTDILDMAARASREIGGSVKLTKSALSQYLSGKVEPRQKKLVLLARTLGVQEAWLIGYDVPQTHPVNQETDDQSPPPRIAVLTRGWNNLSDEQQAMLLRAAEAMFPVAFGKEIDDD